MGSPLAEKVNLGLNFIVKTASNVCALNYGSHASLNTVGQYLGRLITRLPTAYNAFIGGAAISIIGDVAERGLAIAFKKRENIKFVAQILIRPIIGAGLFAAGTALTGGGALVPALITGAKFGAFLYLADKVAILAIDAFRFIAFFAFSVLSFITFCCSEKVENAFIAVAGFVIPNVENYKLHY